MKSRIEPVDASELTVEHIRKLVAGFNHAFERNDAYKGFDLLVIEVLLAQIDRLRSALTKIVIDGDFTAPEGMKRIARDALAEYQFDETNDTRKEA